MSRMRCIETKNEFGSMIAAPDKDGIWIPQDDGEVCFVSNHHDMSAIFIYNSNGGRCTSYYVALLRAGGSVWLNQADYVCKGICIDILRPATDYEKQLLFKRLSEENLRWNADARILESTRWRAGKGETYYYLIFSETDYKVVSAVDKDTSDDWGRYLSGNYLKTEEAARIAGNHILELLKKLKAE